MTDAVGVSRPVPSCHAPVGTAETRGNPGCPECPDRPDPESKREFGNEDDRTGLRAWLRRLPAVEPELDVEAEERAAIQAEARGEFGPPKPQAEHQALVAALLRGYEAHRYLLSPHSEDHPGRGRNETEA